MEADIELPTHLHQPSRVRNSLPLVPRQRSVLDKRFFVEEGRSGCQEVREVLLRGGAQTGRISESF